MSRGGDFAGNALAGLAGALGVGVTLVTASVALAVYFPLSEPARRLAEIVPLGVVHAAWAENLAETVGSDDRHLLGEVGRLTRRELYEAPASSGAWLRLARVYAVANSGRLDNGARTALSRSYRVAPIDYTIAQGRLLFVFDHWREVDRETRAFATTEMGVLWRKTMLRTRLKQLPAMTSDETGRMAAELLVESLSDGNVSF